MNDAASEEAALAGERSLARARRSGVLCSLAAYTLWGAFPLYFRALTVSPLEVLAQRVAWSAVFLMTVLGFRRHYGWLAKLWKEPRTLLGSFLSASLLSINWFVYIWAVHAGRVVDASLGYFITPLVSVALGVLFLKETLRLGQRLALATAAGGVLWLTLQLGQLPWVGLALALSFGSYGALRKAATLGPLEGLTLETLLMFPVAAGAIVWFALQGKSDFIAGTPALKLLVVCSGPLTAVPLLFFAAGARQIPLSLVGVLQYVSPTLQLLLGIVVWHEPFGQAKLIGYAMIWLGLLVYVAETFVEHQRPRLVAK